jgi:acyl-coenzyme A thioesterase PaaI-like protein
MIAWLHPRILILNEQQAQIKIKLSRKTKNHLGSMYFGALCVGADLAGGIILMHLLGKKINQVSFAFKNVQADFIKRPQADVYFSCHAGTAISEAIQQAFSGGERINLTVDIMASTATLATEDPVARFSLTLSIKAKSTQKT